MAARQLSRSGMEVLVLEAGGPFKPLSRKVTMAEPLRRSGLLGSERNAQRFLPSMWTARSSTELVLVRGIGAGGSTTIACGSMVRATRGLDRIGLDLGAEFDAIERELCPAAFPRERWRPTTVDMFDVAEGRGLDPVPTPKAMDALRCEACGLCEVGCATGAKWDSRRWLAQAKEAGAEVRLDSPVEKVLFEAGKAVGLKVREGRNGQALRADFIVLAAGGIGTAQILRASGLPVEDRLWADIVLTVGGRKAGADMLREPPMVWYTRHERFIVSPYLDILSHLFHRPWRKVGLRDRVGVMVKMADDSMGRVEADGTVRKDLTSADRDRLDGAAALVEGLMSEAGVEGPFARGMLNGGHLGGTVPLGREDVDSMHPASLPERLYVADLSLLPESQGMPTMMTAAALAMRVSQRVCFASGALKEP
jgi:choline dehydrogenase-like flavoprotein